MAYDSTNKIIGAPVGVYDVQRCLNNDSGDVATLCMASSINMWSWRKPIYSTKKQLTADDWKGSAHVMTGYKTGGGLKKKCATWGSITNTRAFFENDIWSYDRPVLDGNCFFRLTDWSAYHHNAERSFNVWRMVAAAATEIYIPSKQIDDGRTIGFEFGFFQNLSDGYIDSSELFGDCRDFFPAVIMTPSGMKTYGGHDCYFIQTADKKVGQLISEGVEVITISFKAGEFARRIMADWGATQYSGPLQNNYMWSVCLALIDVASPMITGENHHIGSGINVVSLEYTYGASTRYLPIKQEGSIQGAVAIRVTLTRQSGSSWGNLKYAISKIEIRLTKTKSGQHKFSSNAQFQTPSGMVYLQNISSGNPLTVDNFITNIQFDNATGTQTLTLTPPTPVIYTCTNTTAGNTLFIGSLTLVPYSGNVEFTAQYGLGWAVGGYAQSYWESAEASTIVSGWNT